MRDRKHAVVVGGGIGGLCAAIGLRRAGWRVTVVERVSGFAPVGAGISLYPNAMRSLEALGLGKEISGLASEQLGSGLRTPNGRWLCRFDDAMVPRLLGGYVVGIHRAELHELLRAALPDECVRSGVDVIATEQAADGRLAVRCAEPAGIDDADLVVAADGIDSRLRAQHWPDVPAPVYTGSTAWRGVSPRPARLEVAQTFGAAAEFGIVPLTDGRIYWFGAAVAPPGVRYPDVRAVVLERYARWHAPIPELIETSEVVLHHDMDALPAVPSTLARGRVVLLGDAGHAMTPHMGQGGCSAIEDAVVLAAALAGRPDDLPAALASYDQQRRPRVAALARTSERIRRMCSLTHPVAVAARTALLALTPPAVAAREAARASSWQPPVIATA